MPDAAAPTSAPALQSDASGTFVHQGHRGSVTVRYGTNDDPTHWGYDVLGLPYPPTEARGFPVVAATVAYEGAGYLSWLAWIQVVRYQVGDGPLEVVIDRAPSLLDVDVPFLSSGPVPSLFDAPSTILAPTRWRADDFLVGSPDAVMTKTILPLYTFRWGYDFERAGMITPRPCARQSLDAWHAVKGLIAERHESWRLLDP